MFHQSALSAGAAYVGRTWTAALKGCPEPFFLEWIIQQHLHAGLDEQGFYRPYPFPNHELEFQLRQVLVRVYEHLSLAELAWMRVRKLKETASVNHRRSFTPGQALHEYIIWLVCTRTRLLFAQEELAPQWLKELNLKRLRLIFRKASHRPYASWAEYVWRGCLEI